MIFDFPRERSGKRTCFDRQRLQVKSRYHSPGVRACIRAFLSGITRMLSIKFIVCPVAYAGQRPHLRSSHSPSGAWCKDIGGMLLMNMLISLPFVATTRRFERVEVPMRLAVALSSIAFGFYYAWLFVVNSEIVSRTRLTLEVESFMLIIRTMAIVI